MKNKIVGIFVCMLVIVAVVIPVAGTMNKKEIFDDKQKMDYAPGEFIVKLKKDTTFSRSTLMALNEKHQVYALEKMFPNSENSILDNIYLLHVPLESDILSIVQEYASYPNVVYAEPNGIGTLCGIPNDTNFSKQWYLHNTGQEFKPGFHGTNDADIDAPEAWDIETGNHDVVIAIIDTGIDYTHPDLAANIWNNTDEIPNNGVDDDHNEYIDDVMGWDFVDNDNNPKDGYGHGTICAGTVGAATNNGIGVAGVCWNCKIMNVQVFNETYYSTMTIIAAGIKYAADNGADIISMSLGTYTPSTTLKNVVNYAYGKGAYLCASAGNNNISSKLYPAAYDNVTAVAGTNQNDSRCTEEDWWPGAGSNFGDWVDIAAPANLLYLTMPTYHVYLNDFNASLNYEYSRGTSFSCPIVAGVAALLLSKDPSLTPDEVKALLCGNVDPYHSTVYIGTGRVNAQKALAALQLSEGVKIKGGIGVSLVITNNGTANLTNVILQLQVKGGILGLINKTVNDTVDIKAGESKTVSTGMLLGFGGISISARVAGVEKTAKGTQFLIFSMVKK